MRTILEVKNLKKEFRLNKKQNRVAINDVSFEIFTGETLGLVGESGCGKSTLGRCLLRLEKPTSGEVLLNNKNLYTFTKAELIQFRQNVQMIFQDASAALNPRMTVEELMTEPFKIHPIFSEDSKKYIAYLLDCVGLSHSSKRRYPHELSGGQQQRIVIARALALKPQLLICDEPMSALDVSVQAQIANLLKDLQNEFNLTYLFISHDLSMVHYMSDRVAVMYLGKIVEIGVTHDLYANPMHEYTQELMSAMLIPKPFKV